MCYIILHPYLKSICKLNQCWIESALGLIEKYKPRTIYDKSCLEFVSAVALITFRKLDIWLNHKFLIAPDAIAQVKRGLRGLFSRKKKKQVQQNPTSDGSSSSNAAALPTTATESVPPPTKTGMLVTHLNSFLLYDEVLPCLLALLPSVESNPPPPQPVTTPSPPKAEEPVLEPGSKAPPPPTPSEPQFNQSTNTEVIKSTDPDITEQKTTEQPPPTSTTNKNGMSATSGPLDDQMVHEYSDLGKEDAKPEVSKEEAAPAGKSEITAARPVNIDALPS